MKFNSGYTAQPIQTNMSTFHIFSRPTKLYECVHCNKVTGKCKIPNRCIHKTVFGKCGLPL